MNRSLLLCLTLTATSACGTLAPGEGDDITTAGAALHEEHHHGRNQRVQPGTPADHRRLGRCGRAPGAAEILR